MVRAVTIWVQPNWKVSLSCGLPGSVIVSVAIVVAGLTVSLIEPPPFTFIVAPVAGAEYCG